MASCALLQAASWARAQAHPGFEIAVRAPEGAGCVSGEALTEQIEARAGRPAATADGGAGVQVDVVIEREAGGHRARVSMSNASGSVQAQRELTADGPCSALDDMLVLVIASSVGVSSEPLSVEPPRPPQPPRAPLPEPEPSHASDERSPAVAAMPWLVDLEASGRLLTGTLPDLHAAVGLGLFAAYGAFAVRAGGAWLPPATSQAALRLQHTGGFGELDLCGRAAHAARFAVLLCAGVQAGALYAEAGPLGRETPRWDGLVQLAPRVTARFGLVSWAGLALGVGSTIPVMFPRYSYVSAAGADVRLHAASPGVFGELALWIRLHP